MSADRRRTLPQQPATPGAAGVRVPLLVHGRSERRRDRWVPTFKVHRPDCRYARGADPIDAYLDLWGIPGFRRMCAAGSVTACGTCRPALSALDTLT